ncbi:carbohydrate ABC transporter permease [Glycomyces buryatensis]|uniref:Sugar ABC transporter permease n=1 Tax=Glycomyces buryatensis TaxID=2570927 RepID=A0A4S8PUQ7_9ACTN|nr:sugar ABC transporter permease [Glycomyces buryatensis]THV35240.1 sugar ABC transporter permease [Glycomyces buryatensis]
MPRKATASSTSPPGEVDAPRITTAWRNRFGTIANGLLTLPALVVYAGLLVVPVGFAVYYSFTEYNGFPSSPPQWIGLHNYERIFQDPAGDLHSSLWVTAVIAVAGTVIVNAAALGLALLLRRTTRFNTFARLVMFYPRVLSALIVGFLWQAILGPQGAVNNLMERAGQSTLPFLADPEWALVTLVGVIVWAQFGVQLILYLAGLQAVSAELQESARIDGASGVQVFRHVTWPALAPTVTVTLVTTVLSLLKVYDVVLGLTNGGPGDATQNWAYEILAVTFAKNDIGLASAQAVLLVLVAGILSFTIIALRRRAEAGAEAIG